MTPDEAIEKARWYAREDIATTLRESANVLADEVERLRARIGWYADQLADAEEALGKSAARVRELEEALRDIAGYEMPMSGSVAHQVCADMRDDARAALEGKP